MSNYYQKVRRKTTGEIEQIEALDNYYGKHQYGYKAGSGTVYSQEGFDLTFDIVEDTPKEESIEKAGTTPDTEWEEEVVKHLVDRFLGWRLPKDFHPDGGISFDREYNVSYNANQGLPPSIHEPTGTNLFTADQAKEMFRFLLENEDGTPFISSRDTYWKERVRKDSFPESFTIELLEDNYKKCCLAVNNTRIAGLKPTGFAKTVLTFRVNSKALLEALDTLLDNLK